MCIAILQMLHKKIDKDIFYKYSNYNHDGYGLMYVNSNSKQLETYKTLQLDDFYDKYLTACNLYNDQTPIVLHFRSCTHAKADIENCHPFLVNKNIGYVHNGVVTNVGTSELYSDTNLLNRNILKYIGSNILDNAVTQTLFLNLVGEYNKFIFLTNEKKFLIFNEKQGCWDNDFWYSFKQYDYKINNKNDTNKDNTSCVNSKFLYNCCCCHNDVRNKKHLLIYDFEKRRYVICEECYYANDPQISQIIEFNNNL
jgi:predicted glutamine amidotransferase